jgi:ribonuclease E
MLIDARHREETRVAVVKGNRIEEFDFESAEHKQLKGNIYLAKVTRVEPSLQAAFVDYGGNRHGFLAFSEIHPDYYQIPREDREALLREEAEHAAEEAALREDADDEDDALHGDDDHAAADGHVEYMAPVSGDDHDQDHEHDHDGENGGQQKPRGRKSSAAESADEVRRKRMALRRRYKIQDVIKRRQVLLIQVVKEERGNKGAALTTYLSLAGRYCVLMPNTSHGGGISRKISNAADRKRLKSIIADMNLPSTMGCIVRTAGLQRTRTEIKRDFDYLARLWDEIRENTLKSSAPALIHNDSDLIKRAIRDIYNRDIEEVIIEGEDGYRQAKDFMKLLMPSHARRVQQYADAVSLFQRYGVEDQLAGMYNPVVQLKSGGYLVINPTEAQVSIDINSGRSTREHNIEQTALSTNLEAAREIARQLRLRDMAGLVVIDFIDMEHGSNVRKVEKAMKEALKDDRARIQVGRISGFGLMEMSRQRLRTGVLEASTRACPHCEGTGLVRTASSAGLSALRMLEEEAARGRGSLITLRASQEAAFYVLNNKRRELGEIEMRYGVTISILPDGEIEGARMSVEASGPRPTQVIDYRAVVHKEEDDDLPIDEIDEDEEEEVGASEPRSRSDSEEGEDRDGARRRRRRRRRRGGRREEGENGTAHSGDAEGADQDDRAEGDSEGESEAEPVEAREDEDGGDGRRRSRRGRRGGRRRRGEGDVEGSPEGNGELAEAETAGAQAVPVDAEPIAVEEVPAVKPKRAPRRKKADAVAAEAEAAPAVEAETAAEAPVAKPKRAPRRKKAEAADTGEAVADTVTAAEAVEEAALTPAEKPKRARSRKAPAAKAAKAEKAPAVEAPAASVAEPVAAVSQATETAITPASAAGGENEAPGEPRRGWWQRTFGA